MSQDYTIIDTTPQQCRLRDLTYSAEVRVDIEFTKGKEVVVAKGKDGKGHTLIGRMPIMLRSDRCNPFLPQCFTLLLSGRQNCAIDANNRHWLDLSLAFQIIETAHYNSLILLPAIKVTWCALEQVHFDWEE